MAASDVEARPRIEIVGERRRAHDAEFRARIVTESVATGARVQDIAARYGVCPSLIYRWRRAACIDTAGDSAMHLFPVRIAATPGERPAPAEARLPAPTKPPRTGLIEIELSGGVRVSVDENVSVAALRRVISVLRR